MRYTYRLYSDEGEKEFSKWVVNHDWGEVLDVVGSNEKAMAYQRHIDAAMDAFFPYVTTVRKSTEPPWINARVKRRIKQRRSVYRREGRSATWKRLKKVTDSLIAKRKNKYMDSQRDVLLQDDSERCFFKNIKSYGCKEKPKPFDVRTLTPGFSDNQCAEKLADHFNAISREFQPLEPDQVPITFNENLPVLQRYQVAGRLRSFRKPKSMVRGDLFPKLVTKFADFLAIPLTAVYNEVVRTGRWPLEWKKEYVTAIPKCTAPGGHDDLRNISCTLLISKVLESYVLEWAAKTVKLKTNQYGGVKGSGAPHLLIEVWQKICSDLEDCRAATLVTSIDFAKAFNRLSFQHCLASFAEHGASTQIIGLLATFLSNRSMTVRVQNEWSVPRQVHGGVPQGSILGVFLFNVAIDGLEGEEAESFSRWSRIRCR